MGEGIHDSTTMTALARRLFEDGAALLPSASGISIIDAAGDGGGGITAVPKVTAAARRLGFRTVAFIDWDRNEAQAQDRLAAAQRDADCVVRLPQHTGIEGALLDGLDDATIVGALKALQPLMAAFGVTIPQAVWAETGATLRKSSADAIKSSVGFHAQFIEALPPGVYPPLALKLLQTVVEAAKGIQTGLIQL